MGTVKIYGPDRINYLERMVVADLSALSPGTATLSVIMNSKGGIVDDTIITNMGDHISMIVNGACKHKDWAYFNEILEKEFKKNADSGNLKISFPQENALIALQGPRAADIL